MEFVYYVYYAWQYITVVIKLYHNIPIIRVGTIYRGNGHGMIGVHNVHHMIIICFNVCARYYMYRVAVGRSK